LQVFVCKFLVWTESNASISNGQTDQQDKGSTSENEPGESQFVVKSSLFDRELFDKELFDRELTTLDNHDIN